jgi:hypothetical protein
MQKATNFVSLGGGDSSSTGVWFSCMVSSVCDGTCSLFCFNANTGAKVVVGWVVAALPTSGGR